MALGAPYRHFRDRDSVIAEVARRGFDELTANLERASELRGAGPVRVLEQCAQAHLAFASRQPAMYSAMFEPTFPAAAHPELAMARDAAFAVIRRCAQAVCDSSPAPRPPPPLMVALHVWSLTHGIAGLFVSDEGEPRSRLPMLPSELLEAGLLIYLQSLDPLHEN